MRTVTDPRELRVLFGPCDGAVESFGRAIKRACDAVTFAYGEEADIVIDPERETFHDLLAQLPPGWEPDAVVNFGACHNCIPLGMETTPYLLVGSGADWERTLAKLQLCGSAYDLYLVAEDLGARVMPHMGPQRVAICTPLGHDAAAYERLPQLERIWDVTFVGRTRSPIWRRRGRLLERLADLSGRWRINITSGVFGEEYRRLLGQSKIVFNSPVRGEVNERCSEAAAAGALLLTEDTPDTRCVFENGVSAALYTEENLEEVIERYLIDDALRERVAAAGREVVRRLSHDALAQRLVETILANANLDPARRRLRELDEASRQHALGVAACITNERYRLGERLIRAAHRIDPQDPQMANDLGVAVFALGERAGAADERCRYTGEAVELLGWAALSCPTYGLAALNLATTCSAIGRPEEARLWYDHAITQGAGSPGGMLVTGSHLLRHEWHAAIRRHADDPQSLADQRRNLVRWQAYLGLAALDKGAGNLPRAIEMHRRALEIRPDDGGSRRALAHLLWRMGDPAAVNELERAVTDLPLLFEGWYELAVLYAQSGRSPDLERHLEACIRRAGAIRDAHPGLAEFDGLRAKLHAESTRRGRISA
jgi:tetratricopeptide (TPR) repeat protein